MRRATNEFVKAIDSENAPTASELCISGRKLQPKLGELVDFAKIDSEKKTLDDNLQSLDDAFSALENAVQAKIADATTSEADKGQWADELQKQKDGLDKLKQGIAGAITEYDTVVGGLKTEKANIDKLSDRVDLVFNNPSSFVEVIGAPLNLTSGQAFTISGERVNVVTGGSSDVVAPTGETGGSTINFSAGVGFSTIDDVKIVRQQSVDEDGTTVVSRFGFENNGKFRPSFVAMLNVPVFKLIDEKLYVGPAMGLVISDRGGSAQAEFIVGPTLGIANKMVFLTFGFHAARVEQLAGGFKIGDKVPSELADPLPVQKDYKGGFMFSLTFKLR